MPLAEGRLVLALEVKPGWSVQVHLQSWSQVCVSVCECVCVRREVITYSRQQRALQPVFELCWEEPVPRWPRPQPHLTGNLLRRT